MNKLTVSGIVATAVLMSGSAMLAAATEPQSAGNVTSRQPEDANTPTHASADAEDSRVTQQIRQALLGDSTLSKEAKMVDVQTNHDAVVLRGAVSLHDKETIVALAGQFVGARQLTNELTIQDLR